MTFPSPESFQGLRLATKMHRRVFYALGIWIAILFLFLLILEGKTFQGEELTIPTRIVDWRTVGPHTFLVLDSPLHHVEQTPSTLPLSQYPSFQKVRIALTDINGATWIPAKMEPATSDKSPHSPSLPGQKLITGWYYPQNQEVLYGFERVRVPCHVAYDIVNTVGKDTAQLQIKFSNPSSSGGALAQTLWYKNHRWDLHPDTSWNPHTLKQWAESASTQGQGNPPSR